MDELISQRVSSVLTRGQKALYAGSHRIPTPIVKGGFSWYPHFFRILKEMRQRQEKLPAQSHSCDWNQCLLNSKAYLCNRDRKEPRHVRWSGRGGLAWR